MTRPKLTGRFRTRTGWFGKQILQVEVEGLETSSVGGKISCHDVCFWRDATKDDAFEIMAKRHAHSRVGHPT